MDSTEMMEQQQQQEPEQEEEAQPQQEEQQQVEEEQPTAPVQPMEEAPVQEAVQQEEQQQLQLAIATSFSVVQDEHQDAGEFVIKQEPQEPLPDEPEEELEEQEEHHGLFGDEPMDQELDPAQIYTEVISDSILQRAVSPPTYDPSEHRFEELVLYYKEKYQLKDVTVELESCDKIWETLQLIKNLQGPSSKEDNPCQFALPKIPSKNQPKLPGPYVSHQPIFRTNQALPDFRFSIKSKKKLYHCITCGKEFTNSQSLRDHAIGEHGIYISPKRIYKPRIDAIYNSSPVKLNFDDDQLAEEMETEDTATLGLPTMEPVETSELVEPPEIKSIENSVFTDLKTEQMQVRMNSVKEKIKCVLCKRICTDIVSHMKNYHKVGCISSIIDQCERITTDCDIPEDIADMEQIAPINQSPVMTQIAEEPLQINVNETSTAPVKKKKRNMPRWTIIKKNRKHKFINKVIPPVANKGPLKCNVCLGLYKNMKSYSHHRMLHRIRGETPENFDPSRCRFLNSPLRRPKEIDPREEATMSKIPADKETPKSQTAITDYITVHKATMPDQMENETPFPLNPSPEVTRRGGRSERTSCECGRSFRNYHTMYLHKVKCKGVDDTKLHSPSATDGDSGIGISIKIKKNKNDSYEVVPKHSPLDESFKDSRSSKDSDASSNDSGMVSVDYNNQKVDSADLSKYNKGHSILRIQVAEDDEEVDIEDEDSEHSNLNEFNNAIAVTNQGDSPETFSATPMDNKPVEEPVKQNPVRINRSVTRRYNNIPSLTNLCKQVLSKTKQDGEAYMCPTCSAPFRTKAELTEHAVTMKHFVKSHCPCGKKFKNLKVFNIHVRRYHPLLLKCCYCMTNFDRIEKYMEHKCEIAEGKFFIEPIIQTQCIECKTLVDLGEPFDKHMKTHNTEDPAVYQCFKCELKFDNPHQRRSHFSKEHGFSLCRVCGKLLHIDHLLKHEAYHDGLGHPCHICKKAFAQKTLLKKHMQGTHDPLVNEMVKCIVCLKSMRLRNLKKHMSLHLHTEICRKCNKCYRSDEQKSLEIHIALDHPDDYPAVKCDNCNVSFISDKRYEEHCQEGSCKRSATNTPPTLVQNATVN